MWSKVSDTKIDSNFEYCRQNISSFKNPFAQMDPAQSSYTNNQADKISCWLFKSLHTIFPKPCFPFQTQLYEFKHHIFLFLQITEPFQLLPGTTKTWSHGVCLFVQLYCAMCIARLITSIRLQGRHLHTNTLKIEITMSAVSPYESPSQKCQTNSFIMNCSEELPWLLNGFIRN